MEYTILTPFTLIAAPILILGFLIEVFVFWMFNAKAGIKFLKSLLIVFIANLTTAVLTFFISFYTNNDINFIWYISAFLISVVIEWMVFLPFFKKTEVGYFRLFIISLIGNLITYAIIGFLLFVTTGLMDKYLTKFGVSF